MSLFIALTGLKGAQTALTVTSNNIANANSVGFKRSATQFADVVAAAGLGGQGRGTGTVLKSTEQQFQQGIIEATGNTFDLAINGEGFFATRPNLLSTDIVYERGGAFNLDKQNFVIGMSGEHLLGYPVGPDGRTTTTSPDALRPIELPSVSGVAVATSQIQLAVNLPADGPVIPDQPRYAIDPYVFDPADPLTYNHSTSTTVFDDTGKAHTAQVFYTRIKGPDGVDDTSRWSVNFAMGGLILPTADGLPLELAFDAAGTLTAPTAAIAIAPFDPQNGASPISFAFDPGSATSQRPGVFSIFAFSQDGVPPGKLDSVSIDEKGLITAGFSNGSTIPVARVAIVKFANPGGLAQLGQSTFRVTGDSGNPQFLEAGSDGAGGLLSGSIERANVDLTEELVQLITAQRNFQANAKSIETDNAMTQSILNIRS